MLYRVSFLLWLINFNFLESGDWTFDTFCNRGCVACQVSLHWVKKCDICLIVQAGARGMQRSVKPTAFRLSNDKFLEPIYPWPICWNLREVGCPKVTAGSFSSRRRLEKLALVIRPQNQGFVVFSEIGGQRFFFDFFSQKRGHLQL